MCYLFQDQEIYLVHRKSILQTQQRSGTIKDFGNKTLCVKISPLFFSNPHVLAVPVFK